MTILSLPSQLQFRFVAFQFNDTVSKNYSPFTHQSQTYVWQAKWWSGEVTLIAMKRADYDAWLGFLMELEGSAGTFLLGDPLGATPRGTAWGTPLVKGAGQTGSTLLIDGCTVSIANGLKAGDWFQLGSAATSRLHKLTRDATTDGAGEATITFWPPLREAPADNAPLTVTSAKGVFARTDNAQRWTPDTAGIVSLSFPVEEVLT